MAAKILIVDVETAPILGNVWGIWEQNIGLNMIEKDWHLLSWSAKWLETPDGEVYGPHNKIMYSDQRKAKNVEDDRKLLKGIWKLLNEADAVIWHNGKAFDHKKLNARFLLNGMKPPSTYRQVDTKTIAKKHFNLTSNKLEYLTDKLCKKFKKQKHKKFAGFDLWKECLAGNMSAWKEMEKYNKYDVLSLEEMYHKLAPWDNSINFNLYTEGEENKCNCGAEHFVKNGFYYTNTGKFQRYKCMACGSETHDRTNLLSKEKRASLKKRSAR